MIYDRFQQEAINYINEGFSVVVSAPTGAGKTAIAEHVISECLKKNQAVIYTAPIKALSNQKFRDFQAQFKENIGILTGDVSINPFAPILIMTTEIFRNKILNQPDTLNQYHWVIFDEIHYIDNPERGTVWEEALMFLPKHMNLLGLSATIPNIKEFIEWLSQIHHKPIKMVIEENRPVPLRFFFQCNNQIYKSLQEIKSKTSIHPNKISNLIEHLIKIKGLPCIYFVFGRRRTEDLAWELAKYDFLEQKEKEEIISLFNDLCRRFGLTQEKSAHQLFPLVKRGIAYHHAGMLPTLKEVVERLFTSKLIKVIFTTETFALGINMPAKSVVFDDLRKFYGKYSRLLKTRDFYQMAGRAGRRGIDKVGFVFCKINLKRIKLDEIRSIVFGKTEEVKSQFNLSYATILNLYQRHKDKLLEIYPLSFHYFQSKKFAQKEAQRLLKAKIELLKELNYIQDNNLTSKAKFAQNIYGYELLLSELYEERILEQLDEFELGILSVAVVFEPRKNQLLPKLSKRTKRIKYICEEFHSQIKQKEQKYRIYPFSKSCYFHLSPAIEAWLAGTSFQKIKPLTDTDEGEIVRYFRMAVQILREIQEAEGISYILKDKVKETLRVLNRDIIDAEKQLREIS